MIGSDRCFVRDTFGDERRSGRVVGSRAGPGWERLGVDAHQAIAIDHGALRISSLTKPGWGDTSLAYGPLEQWLAGEATASAHPSAVAFGAFVLNGHNTAQSEPLGQSLVARFKQWLKGNESESWQQHAVSWVKRGPKRWTLRRFAHWTRIAWTTRRGTIDMLDENLSVGFLPAPSSVDPLADGNAFVMHATGASNGELWVADVDGPRRVLASVQNVPLFLLVVRTGGEALFYASSLDGTLGLPSLPNVRPLAISVDRCSERCFASIQQAVSGQIGFAADTRVFEAAVADVTEWLATAAAAHIADRTSGLHAGDRRTWEPDKPAGLIRIRAEREATFDFSWRSAGPGGARWTLVVGASAVELIRFAGREGPDAPDSIAVAERCAARNEVDLQITDDGRSIGVYLGSRLLFDRWIVDDRDASSADLELSVHRETVHDVTVHGRTIELPSVLRPADLLVAEAGHSQPFIDDDFDGARGDLAGRRLLDSGVVWTKDVGTGHIVIDGESARVDATAAAPIAGRTVYTVPNTSGGPVELEIDVVPPGTERGQAERGRAGLVFWQDVDNAILVSTWLDDNYTGASISSFFQLNGYEDLYDAIWTNVGDRVVWGRPYRLRVCFDGLVYSAFVDDELVLYRSIVDVHPSQSALQINRVGIVANWEWGSDTGSRFRRFTARPASIGGPTQHSMNPPATFRSPQQKSEI